MTKFFYLVVLLFLLSLFTMPVLAQSDDASSASALMNPLAMAIAAAGCGLAQAKALRAGCEGVARNPGSVDTIRFFIILGLAFIEFLALLTFVYVAFI